MIPPPRLLRKVSGNRTSHDNRFQDVTRSALHSVHAITAVPDFHSSFKIVKRRRKVMADYDPEIVTFQSSKLIVNLLSTYCKAETEGPLSDESVNLLV